MSNVNPVAINAQPSKAGRGGKYLTFALAKEVYGLEILKVREIIGLMEITKVPQTLPHVKGVINLRGQVITVMDLRSRFGMSETVRTDQTCIIVVETVQGGRKLNTGIIVDRVLEVLNIPHDTIEEPPASEDASKPGFILGMGKVGSSVRILLNIDRVLSNDDPAGFLDAVEAA